MKQDAASIEVRANLGSRIREIRESQGLSQYAFSAMVGLDRSYLIDVEYGRRNVSVDNLFKIAYGLDVSLSTLFEDVDSFIYAHVKLPE